MASRRIKKAFNLDLPQHKRAQIEDKTQDTLQVIGAGLPRSGTTSLKAALEILGFDPCHHMSVCSFSQVANVNDEPLLTSKRSFSTILKRVYFLQTFVNSNCNCLQKKPNHVATVYSVTCAAMLPQSTPLAVTSIKISWSYTQKPKLSSPFGTVTKPGGNPSPTVLALRGQDAMDGWYILSLFSAAMRSSFMQSPKDGCDVPEPMRLDRRSMERTTKTFNQMCLARSCSFTM